MSIPTNIYAHLDSDATKVDVEVNNEARFTFNIDRTRKCLSGATALLKKYVLLTSDGMISVAPGKWYYVADTELIKIYIQYCPQ